MNYDLQINMFFIENYAIKYYIECFYMFDYNAFT